MARTLPPLAALAGEIASSLGGTVRVFRADGNDVAAIAFDGWHRLLLLDYSRSLTLVLPVQHGWYLRTPEDWLAAEPAVRDALARAPVVLSLADVVLGFEQELGARRGWRVRFPGVAVPSGAGMGLEGRTFQLSQDAIGVRVVVAWAGEMKERTLTSRDAIESCIPWLEATLGEQARAAAEKAEARAAEARAAEALPTPDLATVLEYLRAGGRIRLPGGRCYDTFFWDGRLRLEMFDEGHVEVVDASEAQLRGEMKRHPDRFKVGTGSRS